MTGFFNVSPRPSPTPSMRNVLLRPLPSMVIFAFTRPTTSKVGPSSSHGSPPSLPVKIWASASTCLSVVAGSTMKTALPLPSWIALGHSKIAGALHAGEVDVAAAPLVTVKPTSARQLPSFEFGKPPKLQPQPKSQLQNS